MGALKITLFIFFTSCFSYGCCDCDNDSTPAQQVSPRYYQASEMRLGLIDNAGAKPIYLRQNSNKLDSVNKNAFGIQLGLYSANYLECLVQPRTSFSFVPTAKACYCDDGGFDSPPFNFCKLINFRIRTLQEFDSSKLAGADLTEYFRHFVDSTYRELTADSIQFNNRNDLLLMQSPLNSGVHQFEVQFVVSDSLTLTDTTAAVYLF